MSGYLKKAIQQEIGVKKPAARLLQLRSIIELLKG